MNAKVVIDVTDRDAGTGRVTVGKRTLDLQARREGPAWYLYAGDQDELRGSGRLIQTAAKHLARAMGATSGTVEVCWEYTGGRIDSRSF